MRRRLTVVLMLGICVAGFSAVDSAVAEQTAASQAAAAASVTNGRLAYIGPKRDGDRVLSNHVWVMNPDGSAKRMISPATFEGAAIRPGPPRWSPDGTRIAFAGDLYPVGGGNQAGTRLFVVNADGSGFRAIATVRAFWQGGKPSWSPAGTEVAYVDDNSISSGHGKAIRVARVDGSGTRTVALESQPDFWLGTPVWAADGRAIAYLRHQVGSNPAQIGPPALWQVAADGTNARRTLSLSAHTWSLSGLSSTGQLVLSRGRPFGLRQAFELFLVGADGSGLREIPNLTLNEGYFASLSPDDKLVAFSTSAEDVMVIAVDPAARRAYPTGREVAADGESPDWQQCRRLGGCLTPTAANRRPTLTVKRLWVRRAARGQRTAYISFVACDQVGDRLFLSATVTKLRGRRRPPVRAVVNPALFQARRKRCQSVRAPLFTGPFPLFSGPGLYRFQIQLADLGNPEAPERRILKSRSVLRTIRIS